VTAYRIQSAADRRLDEIYAYSRQTWGEAHADTYINGLFERFAAIAARRVPWRAIPAEFRVEGWVCRYERHYIDWKMLPDGAIGIVSVLHERMHQIDRLGEDREP
jgi:toxin ParE1/3/4